MVVRFVKNKEKDLLWVYSLQSKVKLDTGSFHKLFMLLGAARSIEVLLDPVPTTPEIWKRRFDSENTSDAFRPHCTGEIWKRSNHQPFRICVWAKLGKENHIIT